MERLTFEGNFCDIAQCRELPCPYDNNCMQKQVWERLRDYEDFCKTPEELKQILEDVKEIYKEWKNSVFVPCKVGDEIWLTTVYGEKRKEPISARVVSIEVRAEKKITIRTSVRPVYDSDLGKIAFGARLEAEKALEARNGDQ